MSEYKAVSLFSGIGGIDLALQQAGYEIVWANDNNNFVAQTYKKNFPNVAFTEDDIRHINVASIPNIEILTAGFPCQPFSAMGYKRGFKDPRGNLFFDIMRIVKAKMPRIIVLENVKNLIFHNNGKTFLTIYNSLAQIGYTVRYNIMCPTKYANIPQCRERIFIVAFLEYSDCDRFEFPEPVNLTKTINDIIDRSQKHSDLYYYRCENIYYKELSARIIDNTGIYRIDDTGVAKRKYLICPTLKANMGTYHDRVPILRDDFGLRKLTPMECLKFQGFPDSFKFPNIPLSEAYKQAGNTVCVPVIKRILGQIKA